MSLKKSKSSKKSESSEFDLEMVARQPKNYVRMSLAEFQKEVDSWKTTQPNKK